MLERMQARSARTGERFDVRPGPLLVWKTKKTPDLGTLAAGPGSETLPPGWPEHFEPDWKTLRAGMFVNAVGVATEFAATFGIRDGGQLCRLLAAVAQTFLTERADVRRENLRLARSHIESARRRSTVRSHSDWFEKPTPRPRDDERGVRAELGELTVWHASHTGPEYAKKGENQDATHAIAHAAALVFAVADGISTSTGARFAAAFVARNFCDAVKTSLDDGRAADAACLEDAARDIQRRLDALLADLLERWDTTDFPEVYRQLPRDSALRILQNTATPKKSWGPALATTLIGGIVVRDGADSPCLAYVVRIGDGVVEHVARAGTVTSVLAMDRAETALSAFVGPGPRGKSAIEDTTTAVVTLAPGDALLVSSDGLGRGHASPVWEKLAEVLRQDPRNALTADPASARALLDTVAAEADRVRAADAGTSLFNDNVSLVVVTRRDRANAGE